MAKPIIFVIDDQLTQRQMLQWDLRDLFEGEYEIVPLEALEQMDGYYKLLDHPDVLGLLIDQRLNEPGISTVFTGIDLAKYLRGAFPEMPIFLITGYDPDDQVESSDAGAVDAVVHKKELRAGTPEAERFKQRFLRQSKRYTESLTEWQRQFRDLLARRLQGTISNEEEAILVQMETERLIPTQAAEDGDVAKLDKQIKALENMERILDRLNLEK